MNSSRILTAVVPLGLLIVSPVALGTDFTFTATSGVYREQNNWTDGANPGIPVVGDTATIPAGKTCLVENNQAEACDSLTVEDGGTFNIEATGGSMTVDDFTVADGGVLTIDDDAVLETDDFTIEAGGTLGIYDDGRLKLHEGNTMTLDGDIKLLSQPAQSCAGTPSIYVIGDVVIQGDGLIQGGGSNFYCHGIVEGPVDSPSLTLQDDSETDLLEVWNLGVVSAVELINNAHIKLNDVDSRIDIADSATVSGSGHWEITAGELRFENTSTLTGSATFEMAGEPLAAQTMAQCISNQDDCAWFRYDSGAATVDFGGELYFTSGTATINDAFDQCGDYAFGGDESLDLEVYVASSEAFHVGQTSCP